MATFYTQTSNGIQVLKGIKVTPKQGSILGRFSASAGVNVNPRRLWPWPNSYAFGGWIYSASCSIGFGQKPTEITLSITLESPSPERDLPVSQSAANFDISDGDLRCDAGNGGYINENLYDIDFNGVIFSDMVLFSYKKDIQANKKILSVVFKDYSILLDKIYVGLIKRQGKKHMRFAVASGEIPAKCPDCTLTGGFFTYTGALVRDITYGSYVGLNGAIYDNWTSVPPVVPDKIFSNWKEFINKSKPPVNFVYPNKFDLNGGYLMLGTEEIPEQNCGALPDIKYSFAELIASLRLRGLRFSGAFTGSPATPTFHGANPNSYTQGIYGYKQNYIGTLREVLGNWCSDFALDYYCSGKTFFGLDISKSVNVKQLFGLPDPRARVSEPFVLTGAAGINSYSESASLEDSYTQEVITANVRAIEHRTESKEIRRYFGLYPMHPIDFSYINMANTTKSDIFGFDYGEPAYQWDFGLPPTQGGLGQGLDRLFRFSRFTNRTFGDIDTAMALSKYNKTLRDIFVGTRIIESLGQLQARTDVVNAKKNYDAHFKALGFSPIFRVTGEAGEEMKSYLLLKFKGGGNDSATQSIILDSSFYQVFLGYYYQDFHNDVVAWEQDCAENMYKFGRVQRGQLQGAPYVPGDINHDHSPTGGFEYGTQGLSITTFKSDFEPEAKQYPSIRVAPFVSLIPYTGLSQAALYTGFYYSTLENTWGSRPVDFNKSLEFNDQNCQSYSTASVLNQLSNSDGFTEQQWDVGNFAPSFHSELDEFYSEFQSELEELAKTIGGALAADQVATAYYNYDGTYKQVCQKLHVCIIPDVRVGRHPNCYVTFTPLNHKIRNPIMWEKFLEDEKEALKRRTQEKKPTICDLHPLDEICNAGLVSKADDARRHRPRDLHNYECDPNPTGIYRVGFTREKLDSPNSRALAVSVGRNVGLSTPGSFAPTDELGYFYVSDLTESLLTYPAAYRNAVIIYPVSCDPHGGTTTAGRDRVVHGQKFLGKEMYYGIMTTHVDREIRVPEITEIYGEPPNKKNNNTSMIKVINNNIDPDLNPYMSTDGKGFLHFTTLITGDKVAITTVSGYHSVISGLNKNESTGQRQTVDVKLIGSPDMFGDFTKAITPLSGLTSFNITLDDNGVSTDLSFSSRPPALPNQESILNKIGPRLI